jgi:uncharacterized protein YfaA (DUF2138 family)
MRERHDGVFISAVDSTTLMPLIDRLERQMLVVLKHDQAAAPEEEGGQTLH